MQQADEIEQMKLGQFNTIQEKNEIQDCWVLTMNNDETIRANGQNSDIQLWYYDPHIGTGKLKQILKGHKGLVKCLLFSKKVDDLLISGSLDQTLRIWLNSNELWACQQILEGHTNQLYNIILNNEEDELISSSFDKTLHVWVRSINSIEWKRKQTLTEHTDAVYHLSFNPTCDTLATCGSDRLIIWKQNINKLWFLHQAVEGYQSNPFVRVCFIGINELITTTNTSGYFCTLKMNTQGMFEVISVLDINYSQDECRSCFPIIYYKDKRMALCRQNDNNTYLLIREDDANFIIHQQFKQEQYVAGYLTSDGKKLLFADWQNKKILFLSAEYQ